MDVRDGRREGRRRPVTASRAHGGGRRPSRERPPAARPRRAEPCEGRPGVESLQGLGATTVFGLPGQHALGVFDAVRRSS
ncbi:hypothetical protein ACWD6Z_10740, partial [Streptomyces californicus]